MKVCPNCGKLLSYNSYFGAYICEDCNWEDASRSKERDAWCRESRSKHSIYKITRGMVLPRKPTAVR